MSKWESHSDLILFSIFHLCSYLEKRHSSGNSEAQYLPFNTSMRHSVSRLGGFCYTFRVVLYAYRLSIFRLDSPAVFGSSDRCLTLARVNAHCHVQQLHICMFSSSFTKIWEHSLNGTHVAGSCTSLGALMGKPPAFLS